MSTGNQMLADAALLAGCEFFAAQAASATAPLFDELSAALSSRGGRAVKTPLAAEAVRVGLEAAAGGARTLVATAGPGLGACGETLGRAQLAEIPLVLVHCQYLQYPGILDEPVVGDIDVALARHLTPGSIPLSVLAATDAASTWQLALRAFEIAERLRTPVILLTSLDIALTPEAVEQCRNGGRGLMGEGGERMGDGKASRNNNLNHSRSNRTTWLASSRGNRTSYSCAAPKELLDSSARLEARADHLRAKLERHQDLLEIVSADPDPDAQTLLISYGLADQAARRAVKLVRAAGARVSHLTIHSLWPIPEQALRRAVTPFVNRVLAPELNMGLYADELARVLKAVKIESLPRYDGRLIEPETIARRITDWPCG